MSKTKTERQKMMARIRSQKYYLRCKMRKKKFAELEKAAHKILEAQPEFHDARDVWEILDQKEKKMKRRPGRPRNA